MKYLFLDTNIFIQYIDFEQIDWISIFNDDISIVIAPIILKEINDLKDRENNNKRKKRSKAIYSKLSNYLLEETESKCKIIVAKQPIDYEFNNENFSRDNNDDKLLLSALRFRKETSPDIIIVSADLGLLYRAKELNLVYHKMQDKYKIKEELTEEEKEIKQLKNNLAKFEKRQSSPSITFENGEKTIRLKKNGVKDFNKIISKKVEYERLKYPLTRLEDLIREKESHPYDLRFAFINADQVSKYNKHIEDYLDEFKQFLRRTLPFHLIAEQLPEINLYLNNNGTAPTGNLYLSVSFPENVNLYDSNNIKYFYENPPSLPSQSIMKFSPFGLSMSNSIATQIWGGHLEDEQALWDLTINAKKEYFLESVPLSHGLVKKLNLNGIRVDLRDSNSFRIDYKINDDSLIEPIESSLNVIIE